MGIARPNAITLNGNVEMRHNTTRGSLTHLSGGVTVDPALIAQDVPGGKVLGVDLLYGRPDGSRWSSAFIPNGPDTVVQDATGKLHFQLFEILGTYAPGVLPEQAAIGVKVQAASGEVEEWGQAFGENVAVIDVPPGQ